MTEILYGHILACSFFNRVLMMPPTKEVLDCLSEDQLFADWPVPAKNSKTRQGLDALIAFFENNPQARANDVSRDYNQLFIGPTDTIPLWESVWTTKDKLMFSEPTLKVRQFYADHGLEVAQKGMDPDDHIGYEFAFLGHLLAQATGSAEKDDISAVITQLEALQLFIEKHLGIWGDDFFQAVADQAETYYYQGIALLGQGYLQELTELQPSRS